MRVVDDTIDHILCYLNAPGIKTKNGNDYNTEGRNRRMKWLLEWTAKRVMETHVVLKADC